MIETIVDKILKFIDLKTILSIGALVVFIRATDGVKFDNEFAQQVVLMVFTFFLGVKAGEKK